MRLRPFLLASGVLMLSALSLGCADDAPEASGVVESWTVRGIYEGPRFEGQAVHVQHEAIPGLMDAMTMDFLLKDPNQAKGLEPGDKVTFRLGLVDGQIMASDFETLPDTTTLDLGTGEMSPSRSDLDTTATPEASGGSAPTE